MRPCHVFFFFSSRRRHTRSKRDWSSDVCSSDLHRAAELSCYSQSVKEEQTKLLRTRECGGTKSRLWTFILSSTPAYPFYQTVAFYIPQNLHQRIAVRLLIWSEPRMTCKLRR